MKLLRALKVFLLVLVFIGTSGVHASSLEEFPELSIGQSVVFECPIVERTQTEAGFQSGVSLGKFRLVANGERQDLPYDVQYVISDEASFKYDLMPRDRFPTTKSIVRVSDLFQTKVLKKDAALLLDEQRDSLRNLLLYFQLAAALPTTSPDLFAYLIFTDVKGMTLNVSFMNREGLVIGFSGLLKGPEGAYVYTCASHQQTPLLVSLDREPLALQSYR